MLGPNRRPSLEPVNGHGHGHSNGFGADVPAQERAPLIPQQQLQARGPAGQFGLSARREPQSPTPESHYGGQQPSSSPRYAPAAAIASRRAPANRGLLGFVKRNWGFKCTITLVLLLVLGALLLRHRMSRGSRSSQVVSTYEAPLPTVSVDAVVSSEPIPVVPAPLPEPGHDDASHASAGGGEKHVHPAQYEWSHTVHTPERRPSNFPLNGEHPAHNEEKLTPIFERPRVANLETPGMVTAFFSPGGKLKLSVLMSEEGKLGYMLDAARPETLGKAAADIVYVPLLPPAFMELHANYRPCLFETHNAFGAQVQWQLEFGESWWRPVPGNERRHFHETFQQAKVWCEGPQCLGCDFLFEYRLYEHGFAVRAVVDGSSVRGLEVAPQSDAEAEYASLDLGMGVRLPVDAARATCWAQSSEDPYVKHTCAEWAEPVMTPVTVVMDAPDKKVKGAPLLPYRYLTILQADGPAFMRSTAQTGVAPEGTGGLLHVIAKGEMPIHALENQLGVIEHPQMGWATPTSWNVILVADSSVQLAHQASLVYMLSPPPSPAFPMALDARWVPVGKSLRVRGHTTAQAKYLTDFAATYNYQLILFDAGWYGDENKKTSDPKQVAPEFAKDLSMPEVAGYARSRGVGTAVYVNEIALYHTPDLIDLYPRWGLSGIKFGFVDVASPRAMRVLHQRIIAYQHVGMTVNVHDIFRPRGMSRTWPHLVTQEGIRGEERKPDATHHTILPFVRLLQGSADYTPRYLKGSLRCTRAHQLALPLLFFSPIQSLFWAEPGQAIVEAVQLYLPELIMWQLMPTTWDDTRWLAGEVGEFALVGRRSAADWFVGAINNEGGEAERTLTFNLSSLFDATFDQSTHPLPLPMFEPDPSDKKALARGYMVNLYEDDHSYTGDRTGTNANNVKVKLRQQFILPARFSTQVAMNSKPAALAAQGTPFPSDPPATHLAGVGEYRRSALKAQEKQLGNMFVKEGLKSGIPKPTELKSPIFKLKLAPSGGAVIYITPITEEH